MYCIHHQYKIRRPRHVSMVWGQYDLSQYDISHDNVIKWKHFPRYWPFVREIYRSTVNSPHKGQWRGALMFSFICAWINGWAINRDAGDSRRHRAHSDAPVMWASPFGVTNELSKFIITCLFRLTSKRTSTLPIIAPLWRDFTGDLRIPLTKRPATRKWRHNGRDSVSNHQPHDCLLNRLFRRR